MSRGTDSSRHANPRPALLAALTSDCGFALRWIAMLNNEGRRLRQQCERLGLPAVEPRLLHLIRTEGDAAGLPITPGPTTLWHVRSA